MANYPKPTKGSRHNANTGYRAGIRRQLREDRQHQAKVRHELYEKMSAAEKLARLDRGNRYSGGKPFSATKERARIKAQLKAAEPTVATETPAPKKARKEKRA